jgi:hypothetical protein
MPFEPFEPFKLTELFEPRLFKPLKRNRAGSVLAGGAPRDAVIQ